jgi:hypothetical protein
MAMATLPAAAAAPAHRPWRRADIAVFVLEAENIDFAVNGLKVL